MLYPRVSNTEDLAPLLAEPDLHLTWVTDPALARGMDLLALPGSKATVGDLVQLTASGMAEAIRAAHAAGTWVLGVCGGYQMMGQSLSDPHRGEGGPGAFPGLGLLPTATAFLPEKVTREAASRSRWPEAGHPLAGYEIHHGRTRCEGQGGVPLAEGGAELGWAGDRACGAYLHGLMACDPWRASFLNRVRRDRGFPEQPVRTADPLEQRIARWAEHLARSLRGDAFARILAAVGR